MGHTRKTRWDMESLRAEAAKYQTRFAFQTKSRQAYEYARTNNLLDLVAAHMKPVYKTWNPETVRAEALRYSSRSEFSKGSRGAYLYAKRHGVLDEVCSHMKSSGSSKRDVVQVRKL